MATTFAHVKDGVSVLMDAFKQYANKNIIECAKDGFPDALLRCMNPQAPQSSINDDVSTSEPGRNYMQATDKLGPVSFPSSYGEYAAVRIAVFCNYAPDDELDKKGNPTLHFQRDVRGKFYNATMRNLFDTMQTMMCLAGFDPYVAMLILLSSVIVMNTCMLMGPTKGWSDTEEYHYLSQFQLPFAKNIIAYVLGKCEYLVGVMVFGHKASESILPWLHDNYAKKLLIQGSDVFLSHPQNIRWRYTLKHAQHYIQMFSEIMVPLGVVIPLFVDGLLLLRSFLSKKYTLEMMEEFVDSEVLEAVRQRIAMVKIERRAKVEELKEIAVAVEGERAREAKRDKEKREEERARVAKQDKEEKEERARVAKREKEERKESEERSRVKREEERVRVIHQKIEGGKEITIYVNTRAIVSKLGTIKLVGNSRDSILRVKSKLESVVGVTTHEMIISNASDEDMSDKKSLAMCKVAMGSFIIIKRRS
jgi:hypothetical protein